MCEDVVVVKLVKNIFLSLIFQLSPDDKDTKNIALNSKLLFKMLLARPVYDNQPVGFTGRLQDIFERSSRELKSVQ